VNVDRAPSATGDERLVRVIGLRSAILFVVGSVIGSGIFLTTGGMAAVIPSASLLLAAWTLGGVLAIAGGLTYAEMGAMFPRSGGVYVFLKEAYGPLTAFLYGWAALFRLRQTMPDRPRPYRAWGYPFVPLAFIAGSAAFVLNTLFERPIESLAGLGLLALGLPAFWYWGKRDRF
jgi:amino acid transporter